MEKSEDCLVYLKFWSKFVFLRKNRNFVFKMETFPFILWKSLSDQLVGHKIKQPFLKRNDFIPGRFRKLDSKFLRG